MVRLSRRKNRFIIGILVALAVGWVYCLLFQLNLFHGIDLKSGDFLYKTAQTTSSINSTDKIVIVAIDDGSLEQLGHFSSWPRSYHARVLDIISRSEARIIAFDVLFSEQTADDKDLAAAIRNAGNVILPVAVDPQNLQHATLQETIIPAGIIRPLSAFESVALDTGHANMLPDSDGTIRRVPLIITDQQVNEPALALITVAKYLRRPDIDLMPGENNCVELAGRSIPLDEHGCMMINYVDAPTSSLFKTVPYVDVMEGDIDPAIFKDKIVVVGVTAIGLGDIFWTPSGRIMNGVEIHTSAMQTILAGNFLRPAPNYANVVAMMVLSLLCGLAVLRLRLYWAISATAGLFAIFIFTASACFDNGILLNTLYPQATIAGTFVVTNLYNYTTERLEKNEITRTFGKYVSPAVATTILDALEEGSLTMGGEERTVTILLADVRNFTGISENINPQGLVSILNNYLSVIIDAVIKHDGMVNKFGGDSIMAVWNAPVACPAHATLATMAALRAQHAITCLQSKAMNLPKMEFGIGVNTGNAVAGNMGSIERLEYSVIGDAVNTAARLAGATTGGKVWIGKETYNIVKDHVIAESLDPLLLKGKQERFQAYEVHSIDFDKLAKQVK